MALHIASAAAHTICSCGHYKARSIYSIAVVWISSMPADILEC